MYDSLDLKKKMGNIITLLHFATTQKLWIRWYYFPKKNDRPTTAVAIAPERKMKGGLGLINWETGGLTSGGENKKNNVLKWE